jgi:starvation-inducible DNA-binding protein
MVTARTFPTHVDLPESDRTAVIELLNAQLAATLDLYSQTKQAHWNVKGKDFFQLHELFDTLAETTLEHVDLIAERATALGGSAMGTVRMSAAGSALPEYPIAATDGPEHVAALVERYGNYAASTRAAIDRSNECHDADTADLFTEVSRAVDKHLWFLEAHLQA